jgi:hypothetical protein
MAGEKDVEAYSNVTPTIEPSSSTAVTTGVFEAPVPLKSPARTSH